MNGGSWQMAATLLAVIAPLVGVPLAAITFYLRSLREHQVGRWRDLSRRADLSDAAMSRLDQELYTLRRDGATKEEWLRESLWARSQIEKLTASMARAETELDGMTMLLTTAERTERRVAAIGECLQVTGDGRHKELG